MKNLIKALSFAAIVGFFATACNSDPCKDVVCGTEGDCVEGICECRLGYEEDTAGLCNIKMNSKFVGSFQAAEACDTSTYNYTLPITANSSATKFNIADLYLTGTLMICDITTSDPATPTNVGKKFTIPSQTISTGLTCSGEGIINAATRVITVSYTINDGTSSQSCSAVLSPL
jgi:hypothetical protein